MVQRRLGEDVEDAAGGARLRVRGDRGAVQPLEVAEFAETQIGKQLVNNTKLIPAEVTEVSSSFDASEAGYWLYVTVKATATFSGNVWKVGSQEVRVGYEYILKTSEFELTGIISGMEADNG